MIRFGHFYVNATFVLYDVCTETIGGQARYVASLSGDPRVRVAAADSRWAVRQLEAYVADRLRPAA